MTSLEMLKMRLDGATFQEIADACGITRQAACDRTNRYLKKIALRRRGKKFYVESIKYKGIYEYFCRNEEETVTSFANKIFESVDGSTPGKVRNFITGKSNSHFTITQIQRMCEICGDSFENVFEEREVEEEENDD